MRILTLNLIWNDGAKFFRRFREMYLGFRKIIRILRIIREKREKERAQKFDDRLLIEVKI